MPRKYLGIAMTVLAVCLPAAAAELPGTWTAEANGVEYDLTFDASGGLSIVEDDQAVVVAQYETGDGELVIKDLGGAKACGEGRAQGRYQYTLASGKLSLSRVEDACDKRVSILDGTTFQQSDS